MNEVVTEARTAVGRGTIRLSWGALVGAVFVSLGIWAMLYSLGLALGLSSVDPNNPSSLRGAGMGTGVWSVIAPLVALFFGGMFAARSSHALDRTTATMHGAVVWSVSTVLGIFLLGSVLSAIVGGAVKVGGTAATAALGAAGAAVSQGGNVAQALGLDTSSLVAPINQKLQAQGKPAVTAEQLKNATSSVAQKAIQNGGNLDRETLVSSISQQTSLSREDSEDIANQVSTAFDQQKQKVTQTLQSAQRTALQGVDATGKVFWGIFAALALGLISALLGSLAGVDRQEMRATAVPTSGSRREEVSPSR